MIANFSHFFKSFRGAAIFGAGRAPIAGGRVWIFLPLIIAFSITGCAGFGRSISATGTGEAVEMGIGDIVDTKRQGLITFDELISALSEIPVVYVGETHTSIEDHNSQLAILRKLYQKNQCVMVGMEMFPRSAQPVLDSYVRGDITEEQFLTEVRWNEVWGFPYELYRGLIDFARENKLRIIALNAPIKIVSTIARNGLGSLSPDDRARIARDFHLDDPANRLRMQKEFSAHGKGGIKDFDSFFEAQLAWEETMAETIVEQLQAGLGNCRMLVIIGRGHISQRLGVPYLANLRVAHEYRTVSQVPIDYPYGTFDPNLADYVMITDKSEPPHRPRLGVKIQTAASGKGVEIMEVLPDSPAAKADIRTGDIVLRVDEAPVKTAEELQRAVARGGPTLKIEIERGKKRLSINVQTARE